jgi:hypothetical protein
MIDLLISSEPSVTLRKKERVIDGSEEMTIYPKGIAIFGDS